MIFLAFSPAFNSVKEAKYLVQVCDVFLQNLRGNSYVVVGKSLDELSERQQFGVRDSLDVYWTFLGSLFPSS